MLKSNEFESQRALFYIKTKIPISQNSEIIPNSFKLSSILDKNDHQQNIKTKTKIFLYRKDKVHLFTSTCISTSTHHHQPQPKKKKKNTTTNAPPSKPTTIGPPQITPTQNQITNPPPKTKSQTHQINQPTPISQSYPNQLIPMTIKPLKIAETYPQPRSDFTKPTHSYPRLKACDDSSEAVLRSW